MKIQIKLKKLDDQSSEQTDDTGNSKSKCDIEGNFKFDYICPKKYCRRF